MMNIPHAPRNPVHMELPLQRIRRLIKLMSAQKAPKEVALLKDILVRLRLWEKDLAVHSEYFGQYEADAGNENMVQLLSHQIWRIGDKVHDIEKMQELGEGDMFGYATITLCAALLPMVLC
jgi:hypothetical protein